jgi:hypothetical protein
MKLLPNQSSICPRSSAISRVVARNTGRMDKLAERLADETRRQIESRDGRSGKSKRCGQQLPALESWSAPDCLLKLGPGKEIA